MLRRHVHSAVLLASALGGCAGVQPLPAPTPEVPLAAWERDGELAAAEKPDPASRARSAPPLAKTAEGRVPRDAPARLAPPATTAPSPIPGGSRCLSELGARGVHVRASEPVLGIATPVQLDGTLLGIRFYAPDHRPFLADCRLLLALAEVAPELRALGVTDVRFSGAYVYKLTHPGRMSMHAYGLAADLHAFTVHGTTLEVKRDFARGAGCGASVPTLNQLACRIRTHGLFKEQLGPDDNAAHHDHFHLGLKPLPGELATDLPLPAAPKPRPRVRANVRARTASARSPRRAPE